VFAIVVVVVAGQDFIICHVADTIYKKGAKVVVYIIVGEGKSKGRESKRGG
jgi:hypothetical protein